MINKPLLALREGKGHLGFYQPRKLIFGFLPITSPPSQVHLKTVGYKLVVLSVTQDFELQNTHLTLVGIPPVERPFHFSPLGLKVLNCPRFARVHR